MGCCSSRKDGAREALTSPSATKGVVPVSERHFNGKLDGNFTAHANHDASTPVKPLLYAPGFGDEPTHVASGRNSPVNIPPHDLEYSKVNRNQDGDVGEVRSTNSHSSGSSENSPYKHPLANCEDRESLALSGSFPPSADLDSIVVRHISLDSEVESQSSEATATSVRSLPAGVGCEDLLEDFVDTPRSNGVPSPAEDSQLPPELKAMEKLCLGLDKDKWVEVTKLTDMTVWKYKSMGEENGAVQLVRSSFNLWGIPPARVYSVMNDSKKRRSWDENLMEFSELEKESEDTRVFYSAFKFPLGVTNRDFVDRRTTKAVLSPEGFTQFYVMFTEAQHRKAPPRDKFIRAKTLLAGQIMVDATKRLPNGKTVKGTTIHAVSQVDIRSPIPQWIINKVMEGAPKSWFKAMQKACRREMMVDDAKKKKN